MNLVINDTIFRCILEDTSIYPGLSLVLMIVFVPFVPESSGLLYPKACGRLVVGEMFVSAVCYPVTNSTTIAKRSIP